MEEMNEYSGVDNIEQVNNNDAEINRLKGELSLVVKEISQLRDQIKQREEDFKYEVEEREQDPEWRIAANDYLTKGDRSGIESYRDRDLQRKQLQLDKMNSFNTAILAANKNIEQMKNDLAFYESKINNATDYKEKEEAIRQYKNAYNNYMAYKEEIGALVNQRDSYMNLNKVRGVATRNMVNGADYNIGEFADKMGKYSNEGKWYEDVKNGIETKLMGPTQKKADVEKAFKPYYEEAKKNGFSTLLLDKMKNEYLNNTQQTKREQASADKRTNDSVELEANLPSYMTRIDNLLATSKGASSGDMLKNHKAIYEEVTKYRGGLDALKKKGYTWDGRKFTKVGK